mgnify:CR=1 FL=1
MRIWSFRRSFAGSEMERVSFDEWGNLGQALYGDVFEPPCGLKNFEYL